MALRYPTDFSIVRELRLDRDGFQAVTLEVAMDYGYPCAAHCFIWARTNAKVLGKYDARAFVLMHFRCDGTLGFPGGMADEGESPADAANREMEEEINLDTKRFSVNMRDHLITFVSAPLKFTIHFFGLPVCVEDFLVIEKGILSAKEYGQETFGFFRVPLFNMETGGLETFVQQVFTGRAREQLLYSLARLGIMTVAEIKATAKLRDK